MRYHWVLMCTQICWAWSRAAAAAGAGTATGLAASVLISAVWAAGAATGVGEAGVWAAAALGVPFVCVTLRNCRILVLAQPPNCVPVFRTCVYLQAKHFGGIAKKLAA